LPATRLLVAFTLQPTRYEPSAHVLQQALVEFRKGPSCQHTAPFSIWQSSEQPSRCCPRVLLSSQPSSGTVHPSPQIGSHVSPSPSYPNKSHVHVKLPSVSVQRALGWQLLGQTASAKHSLSLAQYGTCPSVPLYPGLHKHALKFLLPSYAVEEFGGQGVQVVSKSPADGL